MKFLGNLLGNLLDAACRFNIELLRWELNRGVARVYTSKLDVLRNGVGDDFTVFCNGVHFNLLGMLHEAGNNHRVFLRHVGSQFEEAFEFFLV